MGASDTFQGNVQKIFGGVEAINVNDRYPRELSSISEYKFRSNLKKGHIKYDRISIFRRLPVNFSHNVYC